jgi:hypothetical protein
VLAAAGGACASTRGAAPVSTSTRRATPVSTKPDPQRLIDAAHGTIGGIRLGESRVAAERLLGNGAEISRKQILVFGHHIISEQVQYPASALGVLYVSAPSDKHRSFVSFIYTRSPRYHTADGLRVGSSEADARNEATLQCGSRDPWGPGTADCRGGPDLAHPFTAFEVHGGAVTIIEADSLTLPKALG